MQYSSTWQCNLQNECKCRMPQRQHIWTQPQNGTERSIPGSCNSLQTTSTSDYQHTWTLQKRMLVLQSGRHVKGEHCAQQSLAALECQNGSNCAGWGNRLWVIATEAMHAASNKAYSASYVCDCSMKRKQVGNKQHYKLKIEMATCSNTFGRLRVPVCWFTACPDLHSSTRPSCCSGL